MKGFKRGTIGIQREEDITKENLVGDFCSLVGLFFLESYEGFLFLSFPFPFFFSLLS